MKKVWMIMFILCFSLAAFAQDSRLKAGFILTQAKLASSKNAGEINRVFVESASRYNVRKTKLKEGIIPSYEFRTKLWFQNPGQIKLKTLTSYPQGDSQLTETTASDQKAQTSIKIKGVNDRGFSPFFLQLPGDAKRNEEILLQKTRYDAFILSFPIFLFPGEDLNFEYLGVAKSSDQNADVLETSAFDTYRIKLFFEQKTHQLLLINTKFTEPKTGEEIESKYFFSDYREENGISFAHKVIVHENGEIVEERDIKAIELNPKLENNFFGSQK